MNTLRVIIAGLLYLNCVFARYWVDITTSGPVVAGGSIHFKATLFDDDEKADGTFLFEWQDNSLLRHHREKTTGNNDSWSVNYPYADCPPGSYVMQVVVKKYYIFVPVELTSKRIEFDLTSTFSGSLALEQNNRTIQSEFISNTTTLLHKIQLSGPDAEYLNNSATQVLTYWFVDCTYYGITDNMEFLLNYTTVGDVHVIEAFVIPNFDPFPTEPTTTTSTTTTTIAPTSATTSKPAMATHPQSMIARRSRSLGELITNFNPDNMNDINKTPSQFANGTAVKYNDSFPFICANHTIVPILSNIPYGYFTRKIFVKEPVKDVVVSGNNWIQRSEVLSLAVTCKGSSSFSYCYTFKYGIYNSTGNETCAKGSTIDTDKCEFTIYRYFYDDNARTALIIINNDVSTKVMPVAITIYKVNKQAQLSVIVVPVGFSLVAIVLIIFGVAFYVQNRSRYIVEVADFNFGQQFADLEYKTFTERLKDSFTNAFTRAPIPSGSSEGDPVWHTGDNKYDSIS